jgi:glycine hydroxymethyltransferase
MLVDLRSRAKDLTGAEAEKWLEKAGIICNKNGVPQDSRPPKQTSGIRLGTPALTTRGLGEAEIVRVAGLIDRVLLSGGDEAVAASVRGEVASICAAFPLPH